MSEERTYEEQQLHEEINQLKAEIDKLKPKAKLAEDIRGLMGYVQNGSDTTITLSQDDATHTYHVRVGRDSSITKSKTYWGNSFVEAVEKAVKENPPESYF